MIVTGPFTVHEAEVAVFHAWGDGIPVGGPLARHLLAPVVEEFRVGLKIQQSADGMEDSDQFGGSKRHKSWELLGGGAGWEVEMSAPLGAMWDDAGVQLSGLTRPGMSVVVVVRFRHAETGAWRMLQFHDAVILPSEMGEESQRMMRSCKFSAGWLEEFKCGAMPALEPRMRGVIEWRHLGRCVRCWEYDAVDDSWSEDAENAVTLDGQVWRYVSLDFSDGNVALSALLARTEDGTLGGVNATGIGWINAAMFDVVGSSGLTMQPGWTLETMGIAEPLMLPPSGLYWEHPRVVFRVLGRIYATARAGVLAMPALTVGDPDYPIDWPIRLGNMVMYPEGAWVVG